MHRNLTDTLQPLFIDMEQSVRDPNSILVTLYLPGEKKSNWEIKKVAKELFESAIRTNPVSCGCDKTNMQYLEQAIEDIGEIGKGAAVFIRLHRNEMVHVHAYTLQTAPKLESHNGKEYALTQFIASRQKPEQGIVMKLDMGSYQLYQYEQSHLQQVANITANISMEPTTGWGEKHIHHRSQNSVHDTILESVQEALNLSLDWETEFIAAVYPRRFPTSSLMQQLQNAFPNEIPMLFINKDISDEKQLLSYVSDALQAFVAASEKEKVLRAQDFPTRYTQNFHKIIQNVGNGNVEKLFVSNPSQKKIGYITKDLLCSLQPVASAIRTHDIIPWIIRQAIRSSAYIYVDSMHVPLALLGRYNLLEV